MSNLPGNQDGAGRGGARAGARVGRGEAGGEEGLCVKLGARPRSAASGAVSLADSKELDYIQLTVL